jgi:phosphatidylinositol 3-kinase
MNQTIMDKIFSYWYETPKEKPSPPVRVCDRCHLRIEQIYQQKAILWIFSYLPLPDIYRLATVCKSWKVASTLCRSLLRDIQYTIPGSKLTVLQNRIFDTNREWFASHSRWLIHIFSRYHSDKIDDHIWSNFIKKRKVSCWPLMCTRTCCNEINGYDAVELLTYFQRNFPEKSQTIWSPYRYQYIIAKIDTLCDDEIEVFLPNLILSLSQDLSNIKTNRGYLFGFLLERAKRSLRLRILIYWNFQYWKAIYPLPEFKVYISEIRDLLGEEEFSNQLVRGYQMMWSCLQIKLDQNALTSTGLYNTNPVVYPLNCNLKITNIQVNSIKHKDSSSAPSILTLDVLDSSKSLSSNSPSVKFLSGSNSSNNLNSPNSSTYSNSLTYSNSPTYSNSQNSSGRKEREKEKEGEKNKEREKQKEGEKNKEREKQNVKSTTMMLIKHESVLQDYVVMNIIRLIDLILKKWEKTDFYIQTYQVLPFDDKSGFIEIIPNSETLYSISNEKKFSLLNYILDHNRNLPTEEVRERFIRSSAAYSVISYLLGVGDRHLDNIMVTQDGYLFHIDYGYILGHDPKPITPSIRITQDIVDAMGGPSSSDFEKFKIYCTRIYTCLRKHMTIFYSLLYLLTSIKSSGNQKYSPEYLQREVLSRFVPHEFSYEAESQLLFKIDDSYSSYTPRVFDLVHSTVKGTQKTIFPFF